MAGNKSGAAKATQTKLAKDPEFFVKLGRLGGSAPYEGKKGFAALTPEQRRQASIKGGTISRRGKSRI